MGNCINGAPDKALVRSGMGGSTITVGKTVFQLWVCQSVEELSLQMMTIQIESLGAETAKGVRVNVRGVAQVKVDAFEVKEDDPTAKPRLNEATIEVAATHFLGQPEHEIKEALQRTLEGHQRQILGTLTVEELYKDRRSFSKSVKENVLQDLKAMGFGLASYVVQSVDDEDGYMESLGVTQTAIVKREAAEGREKNESEARKKVAVYKADADTAEAIEFQRAHVAVNSQKETEAESDRDLNLKRAAFDREVNQARAEAASAGPIEEARQHQAIVREKTKQLQVEEQIKLEIADQTVERQKKEMEGAALAKLLAQQNEAKAITVIANAEANKVRAMGEADADVIRLKGEAEAKVLEEKAVAFEKYGQAAVVQMIVDKLPEIASKIAAPLSQTEKMVFISSDGSGPSKLVTDQVAMISSLPEAVRTATGFDMVEAVKNLGGGSNKKETEL